METKIVLIPDETGEFVQEISVQQPGAANIGYDLSELKLKRWQVLQHFDTLIQNLLDKN